MIFQGSLSNTTVTDHRFDMDAEPEPIPSAADDAMSVMGGGDNSFHDMDDVEGMVTNH